MTRMIARGLGLLLLGSAAPALGVIQFQDFTLKKTTYKPPATVAPPDASADVLFKTRFLAKGEFVLGPGSDGIDLAAEDVRVTIGDVSQTLPAGSLMVSARGSGKFKSKALGSLKTVVIKPTAGGFKWIVKGNRLLFDAPPTRLSLQIGDDAGQIDLATGAALSVSASVRGTVVSGDPIAGLDGVTVTIPCPTGMCATVTSNGGQFELSASLGAQSVLLDGRPIPGGSYPRILQVVTVAAGVNDVGVFALPELDLSHGEMVTAGAQGSATTVTSQPVSTGGTASVTIESGAVVTFPAGASSHTVSVTEVPLSLIPMDFGSTVASPVVMTTQPGGTTVSPPADLLFPNPYPTMVDGDQLFIYGYNNNVGDWEAIAVGTVQNGGTEIYAPHAIGEFAWYFPACSPVLTDLVGLATVNGSPVPGVKVMVQGRTVTTFAPAQDLDGNGTPDNFFVDDMPGGCPGIPITLQIYFKSTDLGTIITGDYTLSLASVPGGTTRTGTVVLPVVAACGNNIKQLGEQCDGTDSAICPGQCAPDCTCFHQCGNDTQELGEQCDGTADAACPGSCQGDCTCPPACGNGVQDPGEDCDGGDDANCPDLCSAGCTCPPTQQCTLAPGSKFEFKAAPFGFNVAETGTLDFACDSYDPMTGPHTCACGPLTVGATNIPAIGFVCVAPLTGCPAGEITCDGGDPRDIQLNADRNIGTCTGNADCASQCAASCAPNAVAGSGCEGFCTGSGNACTNDQQCLMFNEGLCNGNDPLSFGNICHCQCVNAATGGASAPGTLQCSIGLRLSIETAAPCDGTDTLVRFGDACLGVSTGTTTAQIIDANNSSGALVGPVAGTGAPLTCSTLGSNSTSGLALRGTTAFFGTTLGDTLLSLQANCQ